MDNKKFLDWWSATLKMHNYAPDPDDPFEKIFRKYLERINAIDNP